jgi:ubiquinone/menaquinone biosynthesis C-methylase UbiE
MATAEPGLFTSSLPELYERFLVEPLFRPFAQELLDRTAFAPTDRLLDVARGTGIVARLAQQRAGHRGRLVGVDASPAMLAVAGSVAPTIEWRQGDAALLPGQPDEAFDVVTCHQGLQFFPDRPAALREMRRVLAPGGRVGIATWRSVDEVPLIQDLQRVAERHLGAFIDVRHSLGDADALKRLLSDAGLQKVQIETVTRTVRMAGGAEVFGRLNTMAIVGMSPATKRMTDEERAQTTEAIARDSVNALKGYEKDTELVFSLVTNVAIAHL